MSKSRSWANPPLAQRRVRQEGVYFGTDTASGHEVRVDLDRFATGVHVLGPPGSGKTRLLMWLFQVASRIPNAAVILVNPKGDLGRQARDWLIANGLTRRLVWWSPGDGGPVLGWNPLAPNANPVATHAKAVREAILAAWGQQGLDDTPQLARFLYLSLAVAREQGLTIVEALHLLDPDSQLRAALIPRIRDPFLRELLVRIDARYRDPRLRARQEEVLASAVARLEALVADPVIRAILTQQENVLQMDAVLNGRILIANLEHYRPLRPDDVRLLGRMFLNDALAHVFARPASERRPVFLILDEVHTIATLDLCVALELGRELGLKSVLSHQFERQLAEEGNGRLLAAVQNCARTKVVFGGLTVADLEPLVKELTLDQYDPWTVKDVLTSLELEPMEQTREVLTTGISSMTGEVKTWTRSTTFTRGEFRALSKQQGTTETEGESTSHGVARGHHTGLGAGETMLPDEQIITSAQTSSGESEMSFSSTSRMRSRSRSESTGSSSGHTNARTEGEGEGGSTQAGETRTWSVSTVPFYAYKKRRVVSSRTFLSQEEFLTLKLQEIQALPQAHFILKVAGHRALTVRGPFVRTPRVSNRRIEQGLERVYRQPYYALPDAVAVEESDRTRKLLAQAEPQIVKSSSPRRTQRRARQEHR